MNEILSIVDVSTPPTPVSSATLTPTQFAELIADRIAGRLAAILGCQAKPADPELIDAEQFGELLGVHISTINRRKATGKLPAHIELSSGCHRWRLPEVHAWIEAGCPNIREWEARNANGRRVGAGR